LISKPLPFPSLLLVCAAGLLTLSCLPVMEGEAFNLRGTEVRLTLLHTSDIHSRLVPFDFAPLKTDQDLGLIPDAAPFGGATRMASVLRRERERADRVLHLDSGDCFQGAPIFNLNNGEAEFRFLSEVKLDAAVVGNHEFDSGAQNFANMARDFASFPLLAANYVWEDPDALGSHQSALYTSPFSMHNVKGLRVAVIGMANISSLNSIFEGGNSLQATPLEQNEAARAYVELLRPVADLIVVVSHLGLHEDQELVRGYEAYFEYGRIKSFLTRAKEPWKVVQWFGKEGEDSSVVQVRVPGVAGIDIIMGGHLHVVLSPPQLLTDPKGRQVVLAHSGAFAKYVGRLDVVVKVPQDRTDPEGAEVVSHDYRAFPIDSLWCNDDLRQVYKQGFWSPGEFAKRSDVQEAIADCRLREDRRTTQLMQPYILGMDYELGLTSIFSYAPKDIARRNNSTGGDAPLGNITADSMRKRRRVEAEVALTNSLGIRDNLYAGPVTQESMFNVFPFENTINVMYVSGGEMQELFDFVTERSAGRGCQSQAQISGARFTMDCAQAQLNDVRYPCDPARTGEANGSDCPSQNREGRSRWQCLQDPAGGRCWAHPANDIEINGKPLDLNGMYKIAVNDYIAKGGSGFAVLKRNTTRIETGISLRDSLIGYIQGFCNCQEIRGDAADLPEGKRCGTLIDGAWTVETLVVDACVQMEQYEQLLRSSVGTCSCKDVLTGNPACGQLSDADRARCSELPGPWLGTCSCRDVLAGDVTRCRSITPQLKSFCEFPTRMPIAAGIEDGRIGRRVK
jgi:5'-nucleotidase / UDP-sugar diphosphatase